jgi:aminoglycoside phosphotransferase (APT) family kinase protein
VLTRPDELTDAMLNDELSSGWGLSVASLEYRALGFGSHHWCATDAVGCRSFVTVDDLDATRRSTHETTGAAFQRLRAALATVRAVQDTGAAFAVAPIPTREGDVLRHISDRFALALYPYIDGVSQSGEYESASDRLAVLQLIVTLHTSPRAAWVDARVDDFMVTNRDELERALGELDVEWDHGPYSARARVLLSRHARGIERLLAHYDRRADEARARPDRMVLTHGEPHIENMILTATGPVLVDWDTTLIAPPERDLWMLESGDGSVTETYTELTSTHVMSSMLDLYRLKWDLAEVAIYITQFRRPHTESADARESWKNLTDFLNPADRWPSLM